MVETAEKWTVPKLPANRAIVGRSLPEPIWQVHTCRFRGNTLVEISPPVAEGSPLYQKRPEKYKATHAPVKKVTRFVASTVLRW
jgi:hypothetical protein